MGTPDIARIVLVRLLTANEDDIVRVYCQPDRPKGRGKKVVAPPVKVLAEARGLPVSQPRKLKDGAVAAQLAEDGIDLCVVVAYGRILPPAVFEAPVFDTWNVHASLLPQYRGASPVQHAVLNGESETGVTLMQLRAGLDEGPMLMRRSLPIGPEETSGQLTVRLAELGAETLVDGLRVSKSEGLKVEEQDHNAATFAPMIDKKDGALDFNDPAARLALKVRAYDPWPGTFVPTEAGPLKVLSARAVPSTGTSGRGTVLSLDPLQVQTGDGALEIDRLQAPGRKPVKADDYLRGAGRHISIGSSLI